MLRILCPLLLILGCGTSALSADLEADITLDNRTGSDNSNWPIILTVYKLFGPDLNAKAIDSQCFHVFDAGGHELPHMVRPIPPQVSPGNDQIVFLVPKMRAGESLKFRVTHTKAKGLTQPIDLTANPNNLLPNGGFETIAKGSPAGYEVTPGRNVEVTADTAVVHSGRQSLQLTIPVGSTVRLETEQPIRLRKDGHYHFSFWARTENVAYTGWGFWNNGGTVAFQPAAFRGRDSIALRGTRDWYCYTFDPGGRDDWGVPDMTSTAQAETVKKDGKDVPADLWQKGARTTLAIKVHQANQPFLKDDKTGRVWLDEVLLFEQPVINVDRSGPLARIAKDGAVVFTRPVNMPRMGAFAHEAAERVEAFAMPGERREVRIGIQAMKNLQDVRLDVAPLLGPGSKGKALEVEVESLGDFVEPYKPIAGLATGKTAEFLLGVDVPAGTPAGVYTTIIALNAAKQPLDQVALRFQVLPFAAPDMQPYLVGGIFNPGMGLQRNKALYKCYAKTGFNYILLFDYLFRWQNELLDFAGAQRQVDEITKVAHVKDAIGLYRECNMSEDQPRLWYQVATGQPDYAGPYMKGTDPKFQRRYEDLARQADCYTRDNHWPRLIYMVSDEPSDKRDLDPSMGWLKEAIPDSLTLADAQFQDMLNTWQWYSMPVLDDPIDWTGPLIYDYLKREARLFGFCGTGWAMDVARYQPGLMLAASGGIYWHFWHLGGPFELRGNDVVRSHAVAAMAEGFNDLRYYVALQRQIDNVEQSLRGSHVSSFQRGRKTAQLQVASRWLAWGFSFVTADHDRHLMPYNGVPETWGYDRFYDDWRTGMKESILQLQQ